MSLGITRRQAIVAGALIATGILMRVVPHMPNFSPMVGIAIFSGYYLRRSATSWVVPLLVAVVTDAILGFYDPIVMGSVWLSYVAMALLARAVIRKGSWVEAGFGGLIGAVLFFVVTNFAVWVSGSMYVLSWQGLADCFVAAVPFFRSTLLSGVLYPIVFVALGRLYDRIEDRRSQIVSDIC